MFNLEKRKKVKAYNDMLKSKITSFLVEFRNKYKRFPIKTIKKLSKSNTLNRITKLMVDDVSLEPYLAVNNSIKKYQELGKKLNPSYFNPTISAYKHDANRCREVSEVKDVYDTYSNQLDAEFKQMKDDLMFCFDVTKSISKNIGSKELKLTEHEERKA